MAEEPWARAEPTVGNAVGGRHLPAIAFLVRPVPLPEICRGYRAVRGRANGREGDAGAKALNTCRRVLDTHAMCPTHPPCARHTRHVPDTPDSTRPAASSNRCRGSAPGASAGPATCRAVARARAGVAQRLERRERRALPAHARAAPLARDRVHRLPRDLAPMRNDVISRAVARARSPRPRGRGARAASRPPVVTSFGAIWHLRRGAAGWRAGGGWGGTSGSRSSTPDSTCARGAA